MNSESSHAPARLNGERAFYSVAALAAAAIVFAGFAKTYYLKGLFGAPSLTGLLHVHGIVMTLWFALFVAQVRLVATHRVAVHRRLGMFGAVLALAVVAVGTMTAITAAALGHSPGPPPLQFLTIPLGDMVVFAVMVSLGLAWRHRPSTHKRLMLLGTLGILAAAFARIPIDGWSQLGIPAFFGATDLCILVVAAVDTIRNRRLHPAFTWGVPFIISTQAFRIWLAGTAAWLDFATWLTS